MNIFSKNWVHLVYANQLYMAVRSEKGYDAYSTHETRIFIIFAMFRGMLLEWRVKTSHLGRILVILIGTRLSVVDAKTGDCAKMREKYRKKTGGRYR